jgi:hypothetical protein
VIPAEAAGEIAARSKVDELDFDLLRHESSTAAPPGLGRRRTLVASCSTRRSAPTWSW